MWFSHYKLHHTYTVYTYEIHVLLILYFFTIVLSSRLQKRNQCFVIFSSSYIPSFFFLMIYFTPRQFHFLRIPPERNFKHWTELANSISVLNLLSSESSALRWVESNQLIIHKRKHINKIKLSKRILSWQLLVKNAFLKNL